MKVVERGFNKESIVNVIGSPINISQQLNLHLPCFFYLHFMIEKTIKKKPLKKKNTDVKPVTFKLQLSVALREIESEVLRAKKMFPVNFHNQHEAYAVILEEVDELWDEIKKNQKNYDLLAQRKEATQAAAILVRLMAELL